MCFFKTKINIRHPLFNVTHRAHKAVEIELCKFLWVEIHSCIIHASIKEKKRRTGGIRYISSLSLSDSEDTFLGFTSVMVSEDILYICFFYCKVPALQYYISPLACNYTVNLPARLRISKISFFYVPIYLFVTFNLFIEYAG
jgi:hypothetical protein